MNKKILIGALSLIASTSIMAQETPFKCGSHTGMQKLYEEDPSLRIDQQKLINSFKETKTVGNKSTTVRVIPIVFHIIHEYGTENITDAQIYDQVAILNRDFKKLNADTLQVVSPFDTIIGNANIEFRLASIDPWGNCTNGIDRIYSHLTNDADDYSKLNQWKRNNYLNVWVTRTIGSSGVAGYAYYPTGVTGSGFWRDGIIILHQHIGSIGTGSPNNSRSLTHEIGHWLGLSHTWGNNNDNNVACGDDDIDDTPETKGSPTGICNLSANTCVDDDLGSFPYWGFDVIDNVQNFMDYSYCSVMFTKRQAEFMNNVLDQTTSGRNHLYTLGNLDTTGTASPTPVTCVPLADFYMDHNGSIPNIGANAAPISACVGDPIAFKDASWKAGVTTWNWSFPGGSPSTSTAQNPTVTYANPGWYNVTLTATNSAGSNTITKNNFIYIQGNFGDYYGPKYDSFDQNANFWIVQNPEENSPLFHRVTSGGKSNTPCFKLNNLMTPANPAEALFYNDRLGGSKDYLVSPAYDLSNTSNVTISFDYAYGTRTMISTEITEKLVVYSSNDCGKTWTQRHAITGTNLLTAGYVGNTDFVPTSNSQWKTASFNFTTGAANNKTKFRIEYVASDFSSNFYFDNFNVSGTLGIEDNGVLSNISIAPNPVATGSELSIEIPSNELGMQLIVTDLNGNTVSTTDVPAGQNYQSVKIPMNVAKGCYILTAIQGAAKSTHRVVVY